MTTMTKDKTWVAAVGGILTVGIPLILELAKYLPPEWGAIVGGVIALLTVLGVYHAPYRPVGPPPEPPTYPEDPPQYPDRTYQNPWR